LALTMGRMSVPTTSAAAESALIVASAISSP
jgi:hypothetical protein